MKKNENIENLNIMNTDQNINLMNVGDAGFLRRGNNILKAVQGMEQTPNRDLLDVVQDDAQSQEQNDILIRQPTSTRHKPKSEVTGIIVLDELKKKLVQPRPSKNPARGVKMRDFLTKQPR